MHNNGPTPKSPCPRDCSIHHRWGQAVSGRACTESSLKKSTAAPRLSKIFVGWRRRLAIISPLHHRNFMSVLSVLKFQICIQTQYKFVCIQTQFSVLVCILVLVCIVHVSICIGIYSYVLCQCGGLGELIKRPMGWFFQMLSNHTMASIYTQQNIACSCTLH